MYIYYYIYIEYQSQTQSPQALWPVVGCQERLWDTGILVLQDFCSKTMQAIKGQPIKNFKYFKKSQRTLSTRLHVNNVSYFIVMLSIKQFVIQ